MKSASRIATGCRYKARRAALVLLTCVALSPGTAPAGYVGGPGHGSGSHGGHAHGVHGHHDGGFHGETFIGPVWFGWYPYPFYAPPYYPYADGYSDPAPSVAPEAYWYYCPPSNAYYPYVQYCAAPWVKVTPQSPTG